MKKNKIIIYSILSCIIAIIIFLTIGYFTKEDTVQKKDSSQGEKKQEQVEHTKDNKYNEGNNQSTEVKKEENSESKDAESNSNDNKTIKNREKNIVRNSGNESQRNTKIQDYNGKKLSDSEGVGTTGKVFKSQKEALDFGKAEIKRLTDNDKKKRQFSISKVAADDGSLVGWTVDIFEDNSVEKVDVDSKNATDEKKSKE